MPRTFISIPFAAVIALCIAALPASGQFYASAAASIPMGEFADQAGTGWMVSAGYHPLASPSGRTKLWLAGAYGRHPVAAGDETHRLVAGFVTITRALGTSRPTPFVLGSLGYLDADGGGVMFGGGGGLARGDLHASARLLATPSIDLTVIVIGAGVTF